ncbi:hypothetical protein SK128_022194, partial [Halocaridina rubra]
VEDAGTLWLCEIISPSCSLELKNFIQLEKQLNIHYKKQHSEDRRLRRVDVEDIGIRQ